MKKCSKCLEYKELKLFSKYKDSFQSHCKNCNKNYIIKYERWKYWLITRIYTSQKRSSKTRWYKLPTYTKQELEKWIYKQSNFEEIYNNRVEFWYKKDLKPSVDRLYDYKWYSLKNIQLMTWWENKAKWHLDRKKWRNNKHSKSVIWTCTRTWETVKFYSTIEASRQLSISQSSISNCCNWKTKYTWDYKWEFINN